MKRDDLTPIWGNVAVIVTHRDGQQFVLHARQAGVSPIGPTEQQLVITALIDAATIAVILDIKEARLPVGVACGTMFTTETAALTKISVSGRRDTSDVDVMLEFREIRMAKSSGACAPSGVFVPIAITEQTVGVRRPTLEQMYQGNVTVTRWLRGIQDQMWPTGGDHLIEAINAAERTGETPGSTAYSRAALCSLPGVTSVVLHDCSTIKAMRPGEVAAVVGGGDPESIARVLRGTMRARIVMLGTERSGGDERWFTPETERELHTLLWLRGIASQGPTIDPLDDEIDGAPLRSLLLSDEAARHDRNILAQSHRTPDQRAAVSAHWSAQLRAKVAESTRADAERERNMVVIEHDVDDEPWGTW